MSGLFVPVCLLVWLLANAPQSLAVEQEKADASSRVAIPVFVQELERIQHAIEGAPRASDAPAIAETIPAVWQVSDGTQVVTFETTWLRRALITAAANPDTWPATRDTLRARLNAIRGQTEPTADASDPAARAKANAAVHAILARDEFQQSAASKWRDALQRRIGEWIERLMSRLGLGMIAGRSTAIVFAWAAALIALCALGWWLVQVMLRQPQGAALNLASGDPRSLGAREWALRAVSAARSGNGRDAVRFAYLAAIVRMEEQGVWRVDVARTPREYLRLLRAGDARHALMADLTARFERIWYGHREVAPDDAPRVTEYLETLGCLRPGERPI